VSIIAFLLILVVGSMGKNRF